MRTIAVLIAMSLAAPAALGQQQGRTITLDFGGDMPAPLPPAETQPRILLGAPVPPPTYLIQAPAPPPVLAPAAPPPNPYAQSTTASTGFNQPDFCSDGTCVWATAEYLCWWMRDQKIPTLATVGTTPAIGPAGVNGGARSGILVGAGVWVDDCHTVGFQADYFRIGGSDSSTVATSTAASPLSRPFIDANTGLASARAIPVGGTLTVNTSSDGLSGASVMIRENVYGVGDHRVPSWVRLDMMAGYAYFHFADGLTVTENVPGVRLVQDQFATSNEFNGGQVGMQAEARKGDVFMRVDGLLAMGVNSRSAMVAGRDTSRQVGGFLAQMSNSGPESRDSFSLVPQLGASLGCRLGDNVRLTLGYRAMWWTDVTRPSGAIDPTLNLNTNGTGPNRPSFSFRDTGLWAQGLTLGLEVAY